MNETLASELAVSYKLGGQSAARGVHSQNPSAAAGYPKTGISNDQIRVGLYLPDAERGYYRGTRFDWSGVIYSLKYQGHDYYEPWYQKRSSSVRDFVYQGPEIVAGPCSAIMGPAEEFLTNRTALAYDAAEPGGTFLKIGVGVLRKPDSSAYDRYRQYEIVDPGKWTVRSGPDWVEFTQGVNGPGGYAYLYRKTVRLSKHKPEMVLEHSLKNTGRRTIATSVYDHNFLVLDRQPPGLGITITFPFQIEGERLLQSGLAEIRGNRIVYLKTLKDEDRVSTSIEGFRASPSDYDIRIENRTIGAGMRIIGNRPLSRVLLWSIRSVVAVEPYIDFSIDPGNEFTWKYTYDYYTPSLSCKVVNACFFSKLFCHRKLPFAVTPAKAGVQNGWIPAFAGMTAPGFGCGPRPRCETRPALRRAFTTPC